MTRDLVVVGAGGFGRETLAVADALARAAAVAGRPAPWRVIGVVDDHPSAAHRHRLDALGVAWLGPLAEWTRSGSPEAAVAIAVGSPATRLALAARLLGRTLATLVHPRADLGPATTLGEGVVVCAGAVVSTQVEIGRLVHLNPGCVIGHDTVLGEGVSVNPGAVVSGECRVEPGVLIGANATVLQQRRVGAGAIVGAAACLTRDLPAGAVAKGVPARW